MNEVTQTFLLTSKFCPLGAVCPCPGAIYMYKTMKKLYKIRLQRDFLKLATNDRQDVSVDIKTVSPGGFLTLPWGYIFVLNHIFFLYKIRL